MAGDVVEIDVAGASPQTDGQQHGLSGCHGQPGSQICGTIAVFGPEFLSQPGVVGLLGEDLHQLENRHFSLFRILTFHISHKLLKPVRRHPGAPGRREWYVSPG